MLEAEGVGQPEYEVRELRNDLRAACKALSDRADEVASHTAGLSSQLTTLDEDLVELHEDLTAKGGLAVAVQSLPELPAGAAAIGTVEVTKAPPDTFVQAAVNQDTETMNSAAWGIAGLFVGFLVLAVFWKLVRP